MCKPHLIKFLFHCLKLLPVTRRNPSIVNLIYREMQFKSKQREKELIAVRDAERVMLGIQFCAIKFFSIFHNFCGVLQHSASSKNCSPHSSFKFSLMWLHLHFTAKQRATRCFRSLKPNQTGLFMLMCSNIHLLGLLPNAQFGQT